MVPCFALVRCDATALLDDGSVLVPQVALSFPVAFFCYKIVFGFRAFPVLNFLGMVRSYPHPVMPPPLLPPARVVTTSLSHTLAL